MQWPKQSLEVLSSLQFEYQGNYLEHLTFVAETQQYLRTVKSARSVLSTEFEN